MDLPPVPPPEDPLNAPVRAQLFAVLAGLRRPASTRELGEAVGRHPNGVRLHLERLARAGLIERVRVRRPRGRPRDEWAVAPVARPGGDPPQAYAQLAGWLARAGAAVPEAVEAEGRAIGRELAPRDASAGGARAALQHTLTALGFAPRAEAPAPGRLHFCLDNCPYRDAVRANQAVVCGMHRGITRGLLDVLAPDAALERFIARDPYEAGCRIELAGV
jgi:predicted ArsR family transcriptional regulator